MALLIVLLGVSLLLAVVGEFAQAMRLEAATTGNFRRAVAATHLAEAGYQRALAEILPEARDQELDATGLLAFRRPGVTTNPDAPPRLGIRLGPLAGERFSYRITDEAARINLNRASPDVLRRLLAELGVERSQQDVIVDSIFDWRDANEEHRLNGAESDYYLGLPVPYRSKNADFDSVEELAQVRGVTPEILRGRPGTPGLAEYLTIAGTGAINVNTVNATVLRALGYAEAEIELFTAKRPVPDLSALPTPLRRGSQRVVSDVFRIEAWGGEGGRTLIAVVQRRAGRGGTTRVVPLSWRWVDGEPPTAPAKP